MAMATKVVSPASEINQPQSRMIGWVSGAAGQQHGVKHTEREYEIIRPSPKALNRQRLTKAPDRPQTLRTSARCG